jgi:peptidoglycan/LPS O-acetylase OafA/YrhL
MEDFRVGVTSTNRPAEAAVGASSAVRELRPDIQALRAVAVMSVVLYHLWPLRFRGGFVGVDIFFVISGFLITRHLVEEVVRTGTISLSRFWARRIRRLLPAAFVVLLASVLLLLLLMPRVTWQLNLQEIGASGAYVENWLLGFHSIDYLAAHNSATLVQHYWSLSVEEQFYLGWPLLMLLALAGGRLARRATPKSALRWALGLVGIGSLAFSVVFTIARPPLAFFVTPTRAWEFAAGGLLALAPPLELGSRGPAVRAAGTWTGLLVIACSVLLITGEQPFPGWIALVPVVGAVLVLAGGTSPVRWSPARLAGQAPVQWVGNYSYSLYLWHWPLIVVAPWLLHGPTTWRAKVMILVASLVLAFLTKRFVEDPVRSGRRWQTRRWPSYAFAAVSMVVLLTFTWFSSHQVQKSNEALSNAALANIIDQVPCYGAEAMVAANDCSRPYARPTGLDTAFAAADIHQGTAPCQQKPHVDKVVLCAFGETAAPTRTIVLVGNSHAVRLLPAFDLYGRTHGWKVILAAKTDCMGLIATPVGSRSPTRSCRAWSAGLRQAVFALPDVAGVIFASHLQAQDYLAGPDASPATVRTATERMLATWRSFQQRGIPVIVTEDVPGMRPDSGPECIAKASVDYDPCAVSRSSVVRPNLMTRVAQEHPGLVTYLPLTQYFCDASRCHALIGGVVVYTDPHHLTMTYSRSLAQYLGPAVADVLS